VNVARMRHNLDMWKGLYFSEAVLLTLVRKGMARQPAYELVQRSALRAVAGEGTFRELLGADPDVGARLTAAEIDRAFDLEHHLRHAGAIIDRALAEDIS
jgi:adenylosuccinate lyase